MLSVRPHPGLETLRLLSSLSLVAHEHSSRQACLVPLFRCCERASQAGHQPATPPLQAQPTPKSPPKSPPSVWSHRVGAPKSSLVPMLMPSHRTARPDSRYRPERGLLPAWLRRSGICFLVSSVLAVVLRLLSPHTSFQSRSPVDSSHSFWGILSLSGVRMAWRSASRRCGSCPASASPSSCDDDPMPSARCRLSLSELRLMSYQRMRGNFEGGFFAEGGSNRSGWRLSQQ